MMSSASNPLYNHRFTKLRTVFIALFIALFCSHIHANDEETEAKLAELKKAMEAIQKQLDDTKSNRDKLLKDLESSEKNINSLEKKSNELENQLKNRESNLRSLQKERSALIDKKKIQQAHVGEYVNAAYRIGQQSNIRLLLNQSDPARVSRNVKYYDYFINARAERINDYVATINRLDTIEPEIQYEQQLLKREITELAIQQEKLQHAQSDRRSTLSKLNATIRTNDQKLSAMQLDRNRLEQLLDKVSNYIQDVANSTPGAEFSRMKGKLSWPTSGKLVKRFGSSRVANKLKWQGWLIHSQPGTQVKAIHHGQVVFSDYLRGHGMLIIVDHGKGYLSLYAHNQAIYKELGEWVEPGDIIAAVGNSGGLSDHALYFELRHKGKPINPRSWLTKT